MRGGEAVSREDLLFCEWGMDRNGGGEEYGRNGRRGWVGECRLMERRIDKCGEKWIDGEKEEEGVVEGGRNNLCIKMR